MPGGPLTSPDLVLVARTISHISSGQLDVCRGGPLSSSWWLEASFFNEILPQMEVFIVVHELPDRPLPEIAVLGLLVEGHDAARIAVAFDTSCLVIRHLASRAAIDFLNRYHSRSTDNEPYGDLSSLNHTALLYRMKHIVRADLLSVFALLTARERVELLEAFAYYRAFCNSSVQTKEFSQCQSTT